MGIHLNVPPRWIAKRAALDDAAMIHAVMSKGPSEAEFTTALIALAKAHHWLIVHSRPAKTAKGWRTALQGDKGFPDIIAVRNGVLLVAELKCGRNKPTPEQEAWLAAFRQVPGCRVFVWTPNDWREIEEVLG